MAAMTIDRLDIGIYVQYARRMQLLEQVQRQYHLDEATSVPAQALIVDLYPKLSELELLLGVGMTQAPWAYFLPPKSFSMQRRSAFSFHRVLPMLGDALAEDVLEQRVQGIQPHTDQESREKTILLTCLQTIRELNTMMRSIGGRIGQFLQG